jgi:hypothetical protein
MRNSGLRLLIVRAGIDKVVDEPAPLAVTSYKRCRNVIDGIDQVAAADLIQFSLRQFGKHGAN